MADTALVRPRSWSSWSTKSIVRLPSWVDRLAVDYRSRLSRSTFFKVELIVLWSTNRHFWLLIRVNYHGWSQEWHAVTEHTSCFINSSFAWQYHNAPKGTGLVLQQIVINSLLLCSNIRKFCLSFYGNHDEPGRWHMVKMEYQLGLLKCIPFWLLQHNICWKCMNIKQFIFAYWVICIVHKGCCQLVQSSDVWQ